MSKVNLVNPKINYIFLFLYKVLFSVIYCFLLKKNSVTFYTKPVNALFCVKVLRYNMLSNLQSLVDITVCDNLVYSKGIFRYQVTYFFLNVASNIRVNLRTFTNGFYPLYSITRLFSSANWLEREI